LIATKLVLITTLVVSEAKFF